VFHPGKALAATVTQGLMQLLVQLFCHPHIHGYPHHRLYQHPTRFGAIGGDRWGQTKGVKKAEIKHYIVINMVG
jgi:hypothetical protein